jgi:hypothetical protein
VIGEFVSYRVQIAATLGELPSAELFDTLGTGFRLARQRDSQRDHRHHAHDFDDVVSPGVGSTGILSF